MATPSPKMGAELMERIMSSSVTRYVGIFAAYIVYLLVSPLIQTLYIKIVTSFYG
jgi:hypothetical protein